MRESESPAGVSAKGAEEGTNFCFGTERDVGPTYEKWLSRGTAVVNALFNRSRLQWYLQIQHNSCIFWVKFAWLFWSMVFKLILLCGIFCM